MNFDWPVVNLCKSADEHDDNEDEDEFDHNKIMVYRLFLKFNAESWEMQWYMSMGANQNWFVTNLLRPPTPKLLVWKEKEGKKDKINDDY